ncbi:hypothetical protein BAE46_09530 [Glaciecola punicea]|uniref:ATP-binding cassette domain-containing protein n=1 Tax=Glaciecola punicea TaxID=56804 RepID=UPI000872A7D7|nr:ATP-binding cassette domain-containing protein [Glaciecola punicea]OFA30890.1 hypothetical protein BAE46_09530 [Glaciecola punicea]
MLINSTIGSSYELKNVTLQARVKTVSMCINKGQCWHLLGPNGAGKSSLLLLLSGIETPTHGVLTLGDIPLAEHSLAQLATIRCFLHQQQQSEFDIPLFQLLHFYTNSTHIPRKIEEHLHIASLLHKPLSTLSGGQQQRFHIARNLCQIWSAIVKGEGLILLDEPISHLDVKYQCAILSLLQHVCEMGNTVIMTSHDLNLSQQYASHIGLLKEQQLVFQGLTNEVMRLDNLQTIFDHSFVQIVNEHNTQKYIVSAPNQSI